MSWAGSFKLGKRRELHLGVVKKSGVRSLTQGRWQAGNSGREEMCNDERLTWDMGVLTLFECSVRNGGAKNSYAIVGKETAGFKLGET